MRVRKEPAGLSRYAGGLHEQLFHKTSGKTAASISPTPVGDIAVYGTAKRATMALASNGEEEGGTKVV